ncbi:hypothetical protein [Pseudalkalibacillus decolorationis]|uniref:hypothetical protein n=1 Tax=Pseudalkalibacillus decolorationis TaxID=163879 RepID=UPI0021483831|nr:hypothetical protein [Pseudalkalibacillus decolorationis]
MYGLAPQMVNAEIKQGESQRFRNFPIHVKANKLKIVIPWEDEPIELKDGRKAPGRKYMETVLFTN